MTVASQISRFLKFDMIVRLRRWGGKGGGAILDQGVFSGSNFVLNILLARWLPANEYGAFSVAFAIYLFFSGFQNALILEPMSVLGTAKYSDNLKDYLTGQFFIHFLVTGLSGFVIVVVGSVLYYIQLVEKFLSLFIIGAGLFLPLMLLIWLARRSCYVFGKPVWALEASFVYSLVLFLEVFLVHRYDLHSNPMLWFCLLGMASLAGSLLVYLNPAIVVFKSIKWLSWLREQWVFGRWIVLAAFLNSAGTQVQLFIVAARLGLDQAGAFRALQNFMLPMMQVQVAISTLVLPSISYEFGMGNLRVIRAKALITSVGLTIISFLYLVALFVFTKPAERLLYDGKFANITSLVFLIGFVPLITAIEIGFSLVVRSLQRPVYYAISTGVMAVTGIVFAPFFVAVWGVQGAVLNLILVALASLAVNMWFYRKWFVLDFLGYKSQA